MYPKGGRKLHRYASALGNHTDSRLLEQRSSLVENVHTAPHVSTDDALVPLAHGAIQPRKILNESGHFQECRCIPTFRTSTRRSTTTEQSEARDSIFSTPIAADSTLLPNRCEAHPPQPSSSCIKLQLPFNMCTRSRTRQNPANSCPNGHGVIR